MTSRRSALTLIAGGALAVSLRDSSLLLPRAYAARPNPTFATRTPLSRTDLLTKQSRDARLHTSTALTFDRGTGESVWFLLSLDALDLVDPSKEIQLTLEHFRDGAWSHKASVRLKGEIGADVISLERGFGLNARRMQGRELRVVVRPITGSWNVGAVMEIAAEAAGV